MRAIVLHSGGLDSTILLYRLVNEYGPGEVLSLGVFYGQRHAIELERASSLCTELGVTRRLVDLSAVSGYFGHSSLMDTSVQVPHGHYEDQTMRSTVVPMRNTIMVSVAAAVAVHLQAELVAAAVHAGDHAIYPDCRPVFVERMSALLQVADYHSVSLYTPFLHWTKGMIADTGRHLKVPMDHTWSCYEGGDFHCGKCGACTERREALAFAGYPDGTIYLED